MQLGMNVGLKGLQHLVGHLPSWLSYTEKERIEWLNTIMEEMWPFVDRGVCRMIKEVAGPIINEQLKVNKVFVVSFIFNGRATSPPRRVTCVSLLSSSDLCNKAHRI